MSEEKSNGNIKLFSLNTNRPLAEKIAASINIPLSPTTISTFADGEIAITIDESVRGDEVYVIQSISDPVNSSFMQVMIMVDALRRASAGEINVVLPYYGYARADRKARPREPITAKLVANFLQIDGVDRVLTLDLHADQVQGFFNIPVDHLLGAPLLAKYFYTNDLLDNIVVVAPDHAGVSRARNFAELLKAPIAIIDNRSEDEFDPEPDSVIGDVKGKTAVIIDDMIDTADRMTVSADILKSSGAKDVYAVATHAVFSGRAAESLEQSKLTKVIVTDSIAVPAEKQFDKLAVMSVADLIGEAILRIHNNQPVDELFISKQNPDVKLR
ncbi:ribose-phosphate diphosphokinase [Furfurilactobacillus milii]|uniref:Putative ribose-phosphate pyrophosphokinase n=1 Tax=Furfurilactobacillus milii TaxID=2888272 RepID=A0ABT6DBJ7_9LACO|nr:ribose-phosphate diphosphokinase [Furfurilactobacillus milii]QLE66266.1 Ribose-phosphate pyrophosphokinase [Furfurilactobacillus rossiae]MCF6159724.1 ribose-phosphate diphosphokinase [Furfurilactobacillus milii]MCF6163191.1 ribose-phosphate diphosphokinase [Furfurilactobacillus milii]MDF9912686.1 ribose-phosphate diphosphokinase [Furfurilactobacillus milii]QLE68696.1 Ribose-phosphate pyrophosphokinase [Furfurilactobacillus rossiae]